MTPQRKDNASPQKPKKQIPISRARAPKDGISFHTSSSHVLDLRSMIAQKEIQERKKQQKDSPAKKHTKRTKKKAKAKKEKQEEAVEMPPISLMPHFDQPRRSMFSFKKVHKNTEPQAASTPARMQRRKGDSRLSLIGPVVRSRLMVFVIFAFLCLIPATVIAMSRYASQLEQTSTSAANVALSHAQAGAYAIQQMQFEDAAYEFDQAEKAFDEIRSDLRFVPAPVLFFAQYIPGKPQQAYAGAQLVRAGAEGAMMAEGMSRALSTVHLDELKLNDPDATTGLTDVLAVLHTSLTDAQPHLNAAAKSIQRVPVEAIPEQYRGAIQQAQDALPRVQTMLTEGLQIVDILLSFLGHEEEKRYFVLFQNNHELRPTGGFIGSIALIDISKGVVTEMDVPGGGIYDIAGQFTGKVVSPPPLHLINAHWNIQDANWFPDFPTSAKKVQWFAERSGYPTVDGVIALTPNVIEELLEITGPIDLTEEYDVVITPENFYTEVQTRAEAKFDETTESKKIIGAMTPVLFQKLFESANNPQTLLTLLTLLQTQLDQKQVLMSVNDTVVQQELTARNWSGEIATTEKDYLSVVHANIAGGKTDGVIDNTIQHQATVQADGTIVDTVTLTRVHKGDTTDEFQNVDNRDFVRFYVPQGSELISATGFEEPDPKLFVTPDNDAEFDDDLVEVSGKVFEDPLTGVFTNSEFEKTVFGGWTHTPVGKSSTVTISYTLPFKLDTRTIFGRDMDRYSLLVQKQPGTARTLFMSSVELPETARIAQSFPADYNGTTEQLLEEDLFTGMIVEFR